ncbi:MAG: hypothetical protein KF757_04810 [Phycisphaeraceae bacterium]|nr:hypothetical protein [Phycisphaeraceae bacterium]MCW5763911.1 hypothetical protein [Phycisphaeraceae bacterium]
MSKDGTAWTDAGAVRTKRKRRKVVLLILGSFVLLVGGLVVFAPAIASVFAGSIVASKGSEAISGSIDVRSVSLSWFGPQRVHGLRVLDGSGTRIADVDVSADVGLMALAFGGRDLGTIGVKGHAMVRRDAAGRINLLDALIAPSAEIKPEARPGGGGGAGTPKQASVPAKLRAKLNLDALNVTYADPAIEAAGLRYVTLSPIKGSGAFAPGSPITLKLESSLGSEDRTGRTAGAGAIGMNVSIADLVGADGVVDDRKAVLDATVTLTRLDAALADVLLDVPMDLSRAFGSPVSGTIAAKGKFDALAIDVDVSAQHVKVAGAVDVRSDAISSRKGIRASLSKEALEAIDRAWLTEVTAGSLDVQAMPGVTIEVSEFVYPLAPASLGFAGVRAQVDVTPMEAVVRFGEDEASVRRVSTSALLLKLESATLAESARATGSVGFEVNGRAGGQLNLDLLANGLVDDRGILREDGLQGVTGSMAVTGVDTAVLQPFVAASGVNLQQEVGPTLTVRGDVGRVMEGVSRFAGLVESTNVNGEIHLLLEGSTLRSDDPAGELRIGTLGPLLTRLFEASGVVVEQGGSVEAHLQHLLVNVESMLAGATVGPTDVEVRAEVMLGPTSGTMLVDGRRVSYAINQVGALMEFAGPARAARIRSVASGKFDGQPAGQAAAEFRIDGVVGNEGGWSFGFPSAVVGRAELVGVSTAIAEPFLRASGVDAGALVGPTVDLELEAASLGGGTTQIKLGLTSERLLADGAFLLREEAVSLDPAGFTLSHAGLGELLGSMVDLGEQASIRREGGSLEFSLSRFVLPLDRATRQPLIERLDLASRVAVRTVFVDLPGVEQRMAPELRQIVLNTRVRPGEVFKTDITAVLYNERQQIRGAGEIEVPGLMAALGGGEWAVPALSPRGKVSFAEIPASLLAQLIRLGNIEGIDANALAADIAGANFSVNATVESSAVTVAAVSAKGERLDLNAKATMSDKPIEAEFGAEVRLSRPSMEQVMRAFLPEMADTVRVSGATALRAQGTLKNGREVDLTASTSALTLEGLDASALRVTTNAKTRLVLREADDTTSAMPITVNAQSTIENAERARIGEIRADVATTIGAEVAGPVRGNVVATGLRTAWADRLLGSDDLYQGLLGDTVGVNAEASVDAATESTKVVATFTAPALREMSAVHATMRSGAIVLDRPVTAKWRGDERWISRRFAQSMGDKAPSVTGGVELDLDVRQLSLPSSERAVEGIGFAVDMVARVPQFDVVLPGGQKRAFRRLLVTAKSDRPGTMVDAEVSADVQLDAANAARAVDLKAQVMSLAQGGVLTPDKAYLNANGSIRHIPTSLVDALSGMNGWLTEMLGNEIQGELAVVRAPLEGGTISLEARTPTASTKITGSFRDDRADGVLENGFLVIDSGSYMQLSEIRQAFSKRVFGVVPIFAGVEKRDGAQAPSRIDISSARIPMSGAIEDMAFVLKASPGSLRYTLGGPIEGALKLTGQRALGEIGGDISPFDVSMAKGVVNYDNLAVPLGEFTFTSRGDIDVVKQRKNLLVMMPAGAFAVEAFGITGLAREFINGNVMVPMTNAGALDASRWTPDFSKATGDLFKPERLLDDAVKRGIQDLLRGNRGGGSGGGGG